MSAELSAADRERVEKIAERFDAEARRLVSDMEIVGITGTRDGTTPAQAGALAEVLSALSLEAEWLHHGDCVGVDDEAGRCWSVLGGKVMVWPPTDEKLRAFSPANQTAEARPYFDRNRAIVSTCTVLVVVPREMTRQPRGGTWYTHDYAEEVGRRMVLVYPDGTVVEREPVTA